MRPKLLFTTAALLTVLSGSQLFASPVVVACGPGQHFIIRNRYLRGEPITRVSCVWNRYETTRPARYYERGYVYHHPRYYERGYVYYHPRHYERGYVYYQPHRSWRKSALIIVGSAGIGAGIGGLVGGGKGALIGAALGGGVGSLHEARRRR
jgi:hypothetical protein